MQRRRLRGERCGGLLLVMSVLPAFAAPDANQIIKSFIDAESKNWLKASQYTYVEQADFFNLDKNGKTASQRSETHEIVFVEGESFKKLIARNESPLDAREQAKEDKRQKRVAAQRRKQRRSGVFHKNVSTGSYEDLLTLFDNRLVGEEEIRGHKAMVIESTPKQGRTAANAHEKEVLSFQRKLWIDAADHNLVKSVYTVVGQHLVFMPGTVITWEYEKVNDDAWLSIGGKIDGHLQFAKIIKPAVRTEYRNSGFRKFDVQSTITVDP